MKDFHVLGKNMTRNAHKVAIYIVRFFMDQTLSTMAEKYNKIYNETILETDPSPTTVEKNF